MSQGFSQFEEQGGEAKPEKEISLQYLPENVKKHIIKRVKEEVQMELVTKLKGKLGKAFADTITDEERVDVCIQPSAQGEAIAVTDKRVIIIKAGKISGAGYFGANAKSFYYNQITSVDLRIGMTGGHLQLSAAGTTEVKDKGFMSMIEAENAITFTGKHKEHMKVITEMIRSRLGKTETSSASNTSTADELKKLADLKEQGILSDEEFEAAKKRLLY